MSLVSGLEVPPPNLPFPFRTKQARKSSLPVLTSFASDKPTTTISRPVALPFTSWKPQSQAPTTQIHQANTISLVSAPRTQAKQRKASMTLKTFRKSAPPDLQFALLPDKSQALNAEDSNEHWWPCLYAADVGSAIQQHLRLEEECNAKSATIQTDDEAAAIGKEKTKRRLMKRLEQRRKDLTMELYQRMGSGRGVGDPIWLALGRSSSDAQADNMNQQQWCHTRVNQYLRSQDAGWLAKMAALLKESKANAHLSGAMEEWGDLLPLTTPAPSNSSLEQEETILSVPNSQFVFSGQVRNSSGTWMPQFSAPSSVERPNRQPVELTSNTKPAATTLGTQRPPALLTDDDTVAAANASLATRNTTTDFSDDPTPRKRSRSSLPMGPPAWTPTPSKSAAAKRLRLSSAHTTPRSRLRFQTPSSRRKSLVRTPVPEGGTPRLFDRQEWDTLNRPPKQGQTSPLSKRVLNSEPEPVAAPEKELPATPYTPKNAPTTGQNATPINDFIQPDAEDDNEAPVPQSESTPFQPPTEDKDGAKMLADDASHVPLAASKENDSNKDENSDTVLAQVQLPQSEAENASVEAQPLQIEAENVPEEEPVPLEPEEIQEPEVDGSTVGEKLTRCLELLQREHESVVGCRKVLGPRQKVLEFFESTADSYGAEAKVGSTRTSPILHICGAPGSGKSMTVEDSMKKVRAQFMEERESWEVPPRFVNIHCAHWKQSEDRGKDAIQRTLREQANCTEKSLKRPTNGDGSGKPTTIFVLDEVDLLVPASSHRQENKPLGKSESFLSTLLDWAADENYMVGVVGISNSVENAKAERLKELGFAKGQKVVFQTYDSDDLIYIARAKIGTSVVAIKAMEFLAKKISSNSGDARGFLEGLFRAIAYKKERLSPEALAAVHEKPALTVPDVLVVLSQNTMRCKDIIENLPSYERMVLYCCIYLARVVKSRSISWTVIRDVCVKGCGQAFEKNISESEMGGILERLVDASLLRLLSSDSTRSSPGSRRTTQGLRFDTQLEEVEKAVEQLLTTSQFYKGMKEQLESLTLRQLQLEN